MYGRVAVVVWESGGDVYGSVAVIVVLYLDSTGALVVSSAAVKQWFVCGKERLAVICMGKRASGSGLYGEKSVWQ